MYVILTKAKLAQSQLMLIVRLCPKGQNKDVLLYDDNFITTYLLVMMYKFIIM